MTPYLDTFHAVIWSGLWFQRENDLLNLQLTPVKCFVNRSNHVAISFLHQTILYLLVFIASRQNSMYFKWLL